MNPVTVEVTWKVEGQEAERTTFVTPDLAADPEALRREIAGRWLGVGQEERVVVLDIEKLREEHATKEVLALSINAEGKPEFKYVVSDLATIKGSVGGYLEAFGPVDDAYGDWHGYYDEEGKIKGLPVNEKATEIACGLGWSGAADDFLVGPVVFLGTDPKAPHEEGYFPIEAILKVTRLFNETPELKEGMNR